MTRLPSLLLAPAAGLAAALAQIPQPAPDPAVLAREIRQTCATHALTACDRAIAAAASIPRERGSEVAAALLEVARNTQHAIDVRLAAFGQVERLLPGPAILIEHAALIDESVEPWTHPLDERQDDSRARLSRALDLAPDDPRVLRAFGAHFLTWQRPRDAVPLLQRAIDAAPSDPELRALFEIAVEAAGEWQRLARPAAAPDSPAALEQLRMCTELAGRAALRACQVALTLGLTPSNEARARAFLAEVLLGHAQLVENPEATHRDLENHLRLAITASPDALLPRMLLAQLHESQGHWADAAALYAEAGARLAAWPEGFVRLGGLLLELGRPAEAEAAFAAAIAASPGDGEAYFGLGNALGARDKNPGAGARAYEQALEREPRMNDAWHRLDTAYRALGREDLQEAAALAAMAWITTPHERASLAARLQDHGRLREAASLFRDAIDRGGDGAIPRAWLSGALQELGRSRDAIETYREYVIRSGGEAKADSQTLEIFASVIEGASDRAEALRVYRILSARDDVSCLPHVAEARLLIEMGRHTEAFDALKRAVDIQPDCMGADEHRVRALALAGKTDESERLAAGIIERHAAAVREQPGNLAHRFTLISALRDMGRLDERRAAIAAARGRWPDEINLLVLEARDLLERQQHDAAAGRFARVHQLDPRLMAEQPAVGRDWVEAAKRAGRPIPGFSLPAPVPLPFRPGSAAATGPRLPLPTTLLLTLEDRTIAIGPGAGGRLALAEAGGSLVPRRDGFWSIGVGASFYGWKLGTRAEPPPPMAPDPDDEHAGMCEVGTPWFVGPAHVSFTQVDEGACGERDTGNPRDVVTTFGRAVSLEARPASLRIEAVLGPRAAAALARSDQIARASGFSEMDFGMAFEDRDRSAEWRVERERGRWRVPGLAEGVRFDRIAREPLGLPRALVGHDDPGHSWREIKERIPDALDAFASPWKNVFIVRTPSRLHLILPGTPGLRPAWSFRAPPGRIIAVNWARDQAAFDWVALLEKQR